MSDFIARFTLEEQEPIKANFKINLTPSKVSQLENDLDFVRREEVNIPDVDFDKFATKDEVKNLSEQKVDVSDFENSIEDINVALDEKQQKGDYALNSEVPKLQSITQADYDALTTKEANTLYLIEEENA